MLEDFNKFLLKDQSGKNDLTVEVNWNPKDELTNECKIVKIKLPNGKESFVSKDDLNAMLFIIGTRAERTKMLPITINKSKWYETVLSLKATKDIAKGEQITFPIKLSLPDERREAISELKREIGTTGGVTNSSNGIYVPTK